MPEIPICVALVQSSHDYGLAESFPNMNSSQQTLDLTHLSIIFRTVAEATTEYTRKSVWFFESGRGFNNFARVLLIKPPSEKSWIRPCIYNQKAHRINFVCLISYDRAARPHPCNPPLLFEYTICIKMVLYDDLSPALLTSIMIDRLMLVDLWIRRSKRYTAMNYWLCALF